MNEARTKRDHEETLRPGRVEAHAETGAEGLVHTELAGAVRSELNRLDDLLSSWDRDSEVSRLNRHADTTSFPMSRDALAVLAAARDVSERSGGAFDVTAAPIVAAWGFGSGERAPERGWADREGSPWPVGFEMLEIDTVAEAVRKLDPRLAVDLSAIAKGHGVDRVAALLERRGIDSYLVEVGGEVRVRGHSARGDPWHVAVERPEPGRRVVEGVVEMTSGALATSGDYRNFRDPGEGRVGHIVDARSGRALEYRGFSVSVLAATAMEADAWATALAVLGPVQGWELAVREGLAALFIEPADEAPARATPGFPALQAHGSRREGGIR